MSGSSDNNSGSLQRGFFKRVLGQEQSRSAKRPEVRSEVRQMEMKQRPGFTVSNEASATPGRTARPHEVVISPAVKQLNREGYVVYNTPEKQDVYITIQPDSAFFDDEEPKMVRMAGGSFVSAEKHGSSVSIPIRSEPEPESAVYTQPADIFCNACRRQELEEIDFNEVIIKKNESFETEIQEAPVFFKPSSYENVPEQVMEKLFKIGTGNEAEIAMTSSAEVKIEPREISFAGYREEPEYEVEEISAVEEKTESREISFAGYREEPEYKAEEIALVEVKAEEQEVSSSAGNREEAECKADDVPSVEPQIAEVPAGLYLDGCKPIDSAKADVEETCDFSSFMGIMEAETAVTSVSAPVEEIVAIAQPSVNYLSLPVPKEEEPAEQTACEAPAEKTSETVTDVPIQIEVFDEVADIMRITVPSLHMSEDLIAEFAQDWERRIPEDGLEAYDCVFRPMKTPVKEENITCTASSGSGGRRSAAKPDPYFNFRVD